MRRRAAQSRTDGPAVAHAPPAPRSRALVRVDGTGIRKKIRKDYEKALRDLDNSRGQLDQFDQTDLPQFTRWLNTQFGAVLTELRELAEKIALDELLIFRVRHEVITGAVSYARAYQEAMEDRMDFEAPPPPETAEEDGKRKASDARPDSGDSAGDEELFEDFIEDLFGASGPGERARDGRGSRGGTRADSALPADRAARLKELYRALARRLHPDSQREMTAQKTAWWHQVQEAYAAGDAEQLEVILTLCEIGDSGTTAHTSVSLLQRITARLKRSLREIKRQLTERRREPAWNFSRRTDHAVLAARIRQGMLQELEMQRDQHRRDQEMIAQWKAAAERLKPLRRRKRPRPPSDCPF